MANRSVTVYVEQNQVLTIGGGTSGSRLTMEDGDVLTVTHNAFLSVGGAITVSGFTTGVWTSSLSMTLAEGASQTRTVKAGATLGAINLTCSETGSSNGTIFIEIIGADTTPDAFSIGPDLTANPSEIVYFNSVTVTGIDSPTSASITNGEIAFQSGTTAERTFATSKTVNNNDVLLVRSTAPVDYSQSKTVTLNIGGVTDAAVLSTSADPASGETLSLGIVSGEIDMDSILDLFMGQNQPFWGYTRPSSMSNLYRGGSYVPNITANNSIPASGTISLSNFYSCQTSFYLVTAPPSKSVFIDTSTGSGSYTGTLYWELGTDFELGYGVGQKYNSEKYYVVTQNIGSVSVSAGATYNIGNNSVSLSKTVSGNVEEFNSGTITVYIRSLIDTSKVITRSFNYAINFFGP